MTNRIHEMFEVACEANAASESKIYFSRIENKRSKFRDIHAFLLLEELLGEAAGGCLISASEHDTYYLSVDLEDIQDKLTQEHVNELVACGVYYDSQQDCLYCFP